MRQVTLPYDPALHAHLVEHGVEVRALNTGRQMELVHGLARAATPFALAGFLISVLTLWPTFTAKLDQYAAPCSMQQLASSQSLGHTTAALNRAAAV